MRRTCTGSGSQKFAQLRLEQLSTHMAPTTRTAFDAQTVPHAPEDPLFGLMAAYRKDSSADKVDLGIGAYRDDNAQPWVLPVVKKVCRLAYGAWISLAVSVECLLVFAGRRTLTRRSEAEP